MADLKPKVLSANGYDKLLDDGDNLVLVNAPSADNHGVNKKYVDDADTALDGKIDAEEQNRIDADNAIQGQIDAIVDPGGDGGDPVYVRKAGDNMTGNLTLDTDKIVLNTDGSATFGGNIEVKKADDQFATIESAGVIKLRNDYLADSKSDAIRVTNGDGDAINVKYDGSAEFVGGVDGKFFRANEPNGAGVDSACFLGQLAGVETSRIKADGSATFAGPLEAASIDGGTY